MRTHPPAINSTVPPVEMRVLIPALLFSLLLFLVPLVPDVRLARPKMMLLELGIYSILFLWAGIQFYTGTLRIKKSAVYMPLAVYVAAAAFFFVHSSDRLVAITELKRSLISCAALLAAVQVLSAEEHRNRAAAFWISGSFLVSVYGILQHTGGIGRLGVPQMGRVMATFGNPIFFAAHLVMTIPLAAGYFAASRDNRLRLLLLAYCAAAGYALYATQTRAAFIALAASAALFIALSVRTKIAKIAAYTGLLIAGITVFITGAPVWSRQQAHILIWRDTAVMWLQSPFLGIGPGSFHLYFPAFASEELKAIWPQGQFIVNDAHNEFLQILAETGIVGFGIFAWLVAVVLLRSMRLARTAPGRARFVIAGYTAAAAGILVQNIFSVDMRFIVSSVYLFILMGFLEGMNDGRVLMGNLPVAVRAAGVTATACLAALALPRLAAPYRAQQEVLKEPGFFDEKVLEPAKTAAELEALAELHPTQASVFEKLGWIYAKEKNWNAAIRNLEKAAALDPSRSGPLNNLGNIYFLLGQTSRAVENWQKSLAVNPAQVDSKLNLATAYYHEGKLKEASEQISGVLALDPRNKRAMLLLKEMKE